MHIFYAPDIAGDSYTLSEDESKHAVRVLRLQEGDVLTLMDGRGTFYEAEIEAAVPKRCVVNITQKREVPKRNFHLHLAVAPTKNIARFEWFLEKATEIGIDAITPVYCMNSERTTIKPERLERIILSAAKQAMQAHLPVLHPAVKYTNLLDQPFEGKRLIAHCEEDGARTALKSAANAGENVLILIGPEGDFAPEEVSAALAKGYEAVSLGESRLRTETAALVACHTVNLLNQ